MKVHEEPVKSWRSYEEVAAYLLDQLASRFGLARVEGKQKMPGVRSGTEWEIDAKGILEGDQGFLIIECRRYIKSKQDQKSLGALAYQIIDTGAAGGVLVSPLGLQEGAAKIAGSEKIIEVQLNADCAPSEFVIKFLNKLMAVGREKVTSRERMIRVSSRDCRRCGRLFRVTEDEIVCPECRAP